MIMNNYVIIVAGGKGTRMGADLPKQFLPLNGKPVLMHTLELFHKWNSEAKLVLVIPPTHESYWKMLFKEIGSPATHQIVYGGETRFHSVLNGLSAIKGKGLVAIHDAVRPFVAFSVIEACFAKAEETGAAIPYLPMIDSLRQMDDLENKSHPVDRNSFRTVQTPQVFDITLLKKAYKQPFSPAFSDDASVVEALGHTISLVEGNRENIKITTPFDMDVAKTLCHHIIKR